MSIFDGRLEKLIEEKCHWAYLAGYATAALRAPYPPEQAYADLEKAEANMKELDQKIVKLIRDELDVELEHAKKSSSNLWRAIMGGAFDDTAKTGTMKILPEPRDA